VSVLYVRRAKRVRRTTFAADVPLVFRRHPRVRGTPVCRRADFFTEQRRVISRTGGTCESVW
jgi:hypothetical protein